MSLSLIVPIAADKLKYETTLPYVFGFASDGTSLCIKAIQGLDLSRFDDVYLTKLLQKSEMRKDIVIELSYKGFSCASDYS